MANPPAQEKVIQIMSSVETETGHVVYTLLTDYGRIFKSYYLNFWDECNLPDFEHTQTDYKKTKLKH